MVEQRLPADALDPVVTHGSTGGFSSFCAIPYQSSPVASVPYSGPSVSSRFAKPPQKVFRFLTNPDTFVPARKNEERTLLVLVPTHRFYQSQVHVTRNVWG